MGGQTIMFSLFAPLSILSRLQGLGGAARAGHPEFAVSQVAQDLMQRSQARAGLDPHQARELRDAALAYLSVVR